MAEVTRIMRPFWLFFEFLKKKKTAIKTRAAKNKAGPQVFCDV
jgi:hypothetical protein